MSLNMYGEILIRKHLRSLLSADLSNVGLIAEELDEQPTELIIKTIVDFVMELDVLFELVGDYFSPRNKFSAISNPSQVILIEEYCRKYNLLNELKNCNALHLAIFFEYNRQKRLLRSTPIAKV